MLNFDNKKSGQTASIIRKDSWRKFFSDNILLTATHELLPDVFFSVDAVGCCGLLADILSTLYILHHSYRIPLRIIIRQNVKFW